MKHAILVVALAVATGTLATQVSADDKIVIMVGGIEKQIYLPARLTEQLGYFKEQGLDVELQSEPAGVTPAATSNSSTCGQVKLLHLANRIGQILSLISGGGQVSLRLP